MINYCIDYIKKIYDRKSAACTPVQPPNAHLFLESDNAANQAKNNYHFSWMIDYVEEDYGLQTIQQKFTAEKHGKGTCFVYHTCDLLVYTIDTLNHLCFHSHLCLLGVWNAEGGGGKTSAERAAVHGDEINAAFDLYMYLKQHHSQATNSYHEALHQVDKREFHYFPRGTFLAYHPRR